jgi:hypothetical protein
VVRVTPARPPCLLPALPDPSLAALHAQADGNHFDVGQQAMANLAAYDAGREVVGPRRRGVPRGRPVKPLSDAEIQRLAREEPERLIAIIGDPSTDTVTLTFAAERAGMLPGSRHPLMRLLMHDEPVVREGAVYGLVLPSPRR